MDNKQYMEMLYNFNDAFDRGKKLLIRWKNELTVCCTSITGVYETDTEPEDEDYIGEYAAAVGDVEILKKGNDDSISIYNGCIEISLISIPEEIALEDGTILWQRER
ncbi:MAG: hypothetical protein RSA27_07325 [Oscillospiraceae bacterium]